MTNYDAQAGREMPDDPVHASEQVEADAEDLHSGLTGLAAMVSGASGVRELLMQISGFAAEAIPGVDGAGLVVLHAEVPAGEASRAERWGTTTEFVGEIDRIQYELLNEGPCLTCIDTGRSAVSGSLGSDERWPRFGGRVARLGVHSALSLPLILHGRVVGAINAYGRERDVFSGHAVRLGEQFAGPAAVAVHNAQLLAAASEKAEQLQTALQSRAVIDQAIGIIRSRVGGSADEAFQRLRQLSQSENAKLNQIAQRLVDEAVRRAHARHAGS